MLAPGSQFGRYEIQRKLGRGGMGTVYVAHDPVLGRMVAIKLFATDLDLPDASERFTREARSAAALNHANIVTIYDFGDYDSRPYIAMEYVQGETLAEIIKRKATSSLADKLRWIEELCAGAAYAHRVGVVHRDIKPMNLMIDRTGRLKILDFGIAKMLGAFASSATALVGTPGYMAPEQILGGTIDHRADIFSIGVVCYELLSYTEAFPGENTHAITHRLLSEEAAPLAELVPGANPDVVACVERAMRKTAAERLGDADEFRAVLARARRHVENDSGADTAPTVLSPRPSSPTRRPPTSTEKSIRPSQAAVGELTPPPPQSTDRERLAQRRAAQIEVALERSRAALHRGELDVASDECLQALTLDDQHAAALELEAMINVAVAKQRAVVLLGEARQQLGMGALTGAQELLSQARELDPDAVEARRVERDLRLARAEQERLRQRADAVSKAEEAAEKALARTDVETALALARQALELQPDSERARAVEAEALRILDDFTGGDIAPTIVMPAGPAPGTHTAVPAAAAATVVAPAKKADDPVKAVKAKPPARPGRSFKEAVPVDRYVAAARASAVSAVAKFRAQPARQQQAIAGAVAVVLLAAVVGAVFALRPPPVPATGGLVIEAVPFAAVTGIEAVADGSRPALPPNASTPLTMTLPAGTYRVRLVGPAPENESRLVTVEVLANGVAAPAIEPFRALTPAEYFEQYLSSPQPAEDGLAPPAPATSPGVSQ